MAPHAGPGLSEASIRQLATPQSFQRGRDYYQQGAVLSLSRRGDQLQAEVEGSRAEPYRVRVTLDEGGIVSADCTCPYDFGGYCKHIVAVLLMYTHEREAVREHPTTETLLADLDRGQLQSLVVNLVARQPDLADMVEAQVDALQAREAVTDALAPTSARQRHGPLQEESFRRQVHAIMGGLARVHPADAFQHVSGVMDALGQIRGQTQEFIDAGDGRSALVILHALTDAYLDHWETIDDSYGQASGFIQALGLPWAEAVLSADLTPAERQEWADRITELQARLDGCGLDACLDAANAAAVQGWDYRRSQDRYEDRAEALWFADDLTTARLSVLARQGRHQEYLDLARFAGRNGQYALMLIQLGRIQEAVDHALASFHTADEALALATSLRQRGETEAALRVAQHGVGLSGNRGSLARWLRDLCIGLGRAQAAAEAALLAFRETPSLADYQTVQTLAGENWPKLREDLLDHSRQHEGDEYGRIDIFLYEGLVDDAIKAAEANVWDYRLMEKVADAAISSRPEWVIEACRRQAERLIGRGESRYYSYAAGWLEKVRAASWAAGRQDEWRRYLAGLIADHKRKHSLRPMLEALQ